ncbi:hypothetical protein V4C53_03815 [Paraburkholderia azotifigens]|uniref:hypothetical protein n=1 Tax=Paraburkholderia azotifigens TaxID=2057004 RepID=UPI0031710A1B
MAFDARPERKTRRQAWIWSADRCLTAAALLELIESVQTSSAPNDISDKIIEDHILPFAKSVFRPAGTRRMNVAEMGAADWNYARLRRAICAMQPRL